MTTETGQEKSLEIIFKFLGWCLARVAPMTIFLFEKYILTCLKMVPQSGNEIGDTEF